MLLSPTDIEFLTDVVAKCSGNVILPRQAYMLEQQLTPIAKSAGLNDVPELVNSLRRSSNVALCQEVAEAVTVNETSFFRDAHPFVALERSIIPNLVSKNRATRSIRVWCAACSGGQEPYTVAMVLRDHLLQLNDWKIEIVATDISDQMLQKAKSGQYSQLEVNRGLPVKKLVRFFDRKGASWEIKTELKSLIRFQKLNLTTAWPMMGKFDIVFLRNVLIYFDKETKTKILNRVRGVLNQDAHLFLGSIESTIGLDVPFQREEIDDTICYRPR